MYIGKVVQLTGATKKAIHHYESLGLLPDVPRQGKYRIYDEHHIVVIKLIRKAQSVGFKLAEMAPLLATKYRENCFPLDFAIAAIDAKRTQIKNEIQQAKKLDAELANLKTSLNDLFSPAN